MYEFGLRRVIATISANARVCSRKAFENLCKQDLEICYLGTDCTYIFVHANAHVCMCIAVAVSLKIVWAVAVPSPNQPPRLLYLFFRSARALERATPLQSGPPLFATTPSAEDDERK